jgi:hypothetical protein
MAAASGQSRVNRGSPHADPLANEHVHCGHPSFEWGTHLRHGAIAKIHPGRRGDRRVALAGADLLDGDELARRVMNANNALLICEGVRLLGLLRRVWPPATRRNETECAD